MAPPASEHAASLSHDDHGSHAEIDVTSPRWRERLSHFRVDPAVHRLALACAGIGAVSFIAGLLVERSLAWAGLLMASFMLVSFGIAGVLFVALHYLTSAGWSVVVRRVPEALASVLVPGLVGIALVLLVHPQLYSWTAPEAERFTGFKGYWLTYSHWLTRAAIFAGIWLLFTWLLRGNSRQQDVDGQLSHTRRNVAWSAIFVLLFALSYWLASVDWMMTLHPHWFSTIFGVYNFAGMFSSGIALMIVLAVWLRRKGVLQGLLREDHLHDMGKLLLSLTTFWAYIWFSQYMLIWYAHIPEETFYFAVRKHQLWMPLFYLNFGLNWLIPFLALLPRESKRDGSILVKIALIVLAGRLLDLYLMVIPAVSPETPLAGWTPIGIVVGAAGVLVCVFMRAFGQAAVIPVRDPYLAESLHHHT